MKKKLLLIVSMVALLVCLLAICVSAENALKPQTSDAYGELSFFDESITVGRTNTSSGFTPYIAAEGNTYARVVVGDGTTFYTFPTQYILSNSAIYGSAGKIIFVPDLTSLNKAMEAATGTNPNWGVQNNIYRIELPYGMTRLNGGGQNFSNWNKVREIFLQPDTSVQDQGKTMLFWRCYELEVIHNLDTFVLRKGCAGGTFQDCRKLTSVILGVSPELVDTGDNMFYGCTNLKVVNLTEAFPNLKVLGKNAFRDCYALETLTSKGQEYTCVMPSTLTNVYNNAFHNCDGLKAIKFTGSTLTIGQESLRSMNSLEYLYFPKSSSLSIPSCEVFSDNGKLKAVALPDNCTLIPDRGFKNCTSLKAVYLPANLYELRTNGWDQAPFTSNPEMYFVNDWFSVLDENGNFLFDSFEMPERPEVYYFPSTLTLLFNRDSGTGFYNCYKINPVLVFPASVTSIKINDGLLINCGTKGETKTAVFLGDMVKICHSSQDSRLNNIQYVFVNANDKTTADVEIVNNNGNKPASTSIISFCQSKTSYNMIAKGGTYGESLGESHIYKVAVNTPATCVENGVNGFECFCGADSDKAEIVPALGHQKSEMLEITYNGKSLYFENGDITYKCERCSQNHVVEDEAEALFSALGYTYTEAKAMSKAIMQSFGVNKTAIKKYNEYTESDIVNYGVLAATENGLGDTTDVFGDDGAASVAKVNVASYLNKSFDLIEMKLGGLEGKDGVSYMDAKLYCCAFVQIAKGETIESYYATKGAEGALVGTALSGAVSYNDLTK